MRKAASELHHLCVKWFDTGDRYYLDMIVGYLTPVPRNPTRLESACIRHFIEAPQDDYCAWALKDMVEVISANPELVN